MMEQRSEHVRSARAVALAVLGGATVALALLGAVAMGGWGKPVAAQYGNQPSPTPAPTSSPTPTPTPGPTGTPVVTAKITPTEGGTAESEDGLVSVTVPAGAVDEDVTITVTPVDVTSQEGVPSGNVIVGGRVYEIVAVDEDGDSVTQFDEPLQVSFRLTPEELEGLDPNDLFVYYFDPDRGVWVPVPTIVDVDSGIVTAIVPHLTLFAVMRATFYEVPILPGANLLPFTGADGTPVELAFADAIDRISVVWRWDGFSQTWLRHIPGQPALSNFDTLFQYDIVYVVLQGDDEATLRMVAP